MSFLSTLRLICLFCCSGAAVCWAQPRVVLHDDAGRIVRLTQTPQRIVSLLPSLTETVCALGACQRLVGVDRYSNYPASVQALPKVGGGLDPSVEAIVALRPDVVLISRSSPARERLIGLGLKVVVLEPQTYAGMQFAIATLGQLLAVPDAARVWREIDSGVRAAAQSLPPQVTNTRVYFEVSRGPYAAGESSFLGETLTRLGAKNIVPAKLGPFPKLNPEFIVQADPDVVMVGDQNNVDLQNRPGWSTMRALKLQHVCVFNQAESDTLVRPGPRMAEGARTLAACLRKVLQ